MRKKYYLLLAALLTTSLAGCTIRFRTTEPKGENASAVTIGTETTEEKEKSETSEKTEDSAKKKSSSASASPSKEAEKTAAKHFDSLKYRICRDDQSFDITLSDGTTATLPCYVDYIEILDESYPYRDEVNKKRREKASLEGEGPFTTESLRSVAKYEDQMSHPASYYLKGEITDTDIYNADGVFSVNAVVGCYSGGNAEHTKFIGFTLDINTGELLTLPQVLHMEDDAEGVKQVVIDAARRNMDDTSERMNEWDINYLCEKNTDPAEYDFYIRRDGMICYSRFAGELGQPAHMGRGELPLDIWIDDIESEDETEHITKEELTEQVTSTPEEHTYCKNIYETYGEYAFVRKKEQPVDCGDYYEVQVEILESGEAQPNTGEIDNPVVMDTPYLRFSKDCTVCWITDPAGTEYASVVSLDEYAEKRGGIRDFTSVGSMRMIGYPYPITYDKNGYIKTFVDGFIQ
jgi:hypothetical protein